MKFSYSELPGDPTAYLRPTVPVVIEGLERAPLACLMDSGALHNRFGRAIAERAGIDLSEADVSSIAVGGLITTALTVPVRLTVGDVSWEAPVGFCDPWPFGFQILGQEGCFRWFRVEFRAAEYTVELTAEHR